VPDQRNVKNIFTIMPFSKTSTRNSDDLTAFFQTNLKKRIESEQNLKHRYVVSRSAEQFIINDNIVNSLYEADIVLCDLSGEHANPNVMFELGVRLAISDLPVIMFREEHPSNSPIFDVIGYYIHPYSVLQYSKLEEYILRKLRTYELEEEQFHSPVLKTLKTAPSIIRRIREEEAFRRLRMLVDEAQAMVSRFEGDILNFIKDRNAPLPAEATSMLDFADDNREALAKLDWTQFVFQCVKTPAMDAYLVDPMISNFIPLKVESDFTTYIRLYYESIVNFGQSYNAKTMSHVMFMLREMVLFHQMSLQLIGCLLNSPPDHERFVEGFYSVFEQSHFKEDVPKMKRFLLMRDK
jgi:hypothetical protein